MIQGRRVVLKAAAEDPMVAVDQHMELEAFELPEELAAGEARIAIACAAVGWVDLLMTSGLYQHLPPPPYCPGLEYCGVIEAVGSGVRDFAVGDRVIVDGFWAGPRSSGAYQAYGGFATHAIAPQQALHRLPDGFDFAQACHFLGSYETAYHCLVTCGQLQPGEVVLIHGASGATGLAAVHLAKHLEATVIATGRGGPKLDVVASQGADHVLALQDPETGGIRRFRDEVKELTGGKGVEMVFDGVGGDISLESLRCVAFGARFLIVGWAATPFVAKARANVLPTNLLMMKGLKVLGCPTVIATQKDPSIREPRLKQLFAWADAGALVPHTSHRFPLTQFQEALAAKWRGEVVGGCALEMPRR